MITRRIFVMASIATSGLAMARAAPLTRQTSQLSAPNGRAIPLSSWQARGRRRGVIAFSHGAMSSPWKYAPIVDRWVAAGFDVHAPQHTDSLEYPRHADFAGMVGWATRLEDMAALSAFIGKPYIAAGHSYGALTALVLGGVSAAVPPGFAAPLRDPRARCCVAFSPPGPLPPLITREGYATLAAPSLITTGTRDLAPYNLDDPTSWRAHLTAFEQAPAGGNRYGLVLDGVDHYYGGAICDFTKKGPDQSDQLLRAVDASIRFMDAFGIDAAQPQPAGKAIVAKGLDKVFFK
jgi:hypothetical protein